MMMTRRRQLPLARNSTVWHIGTLDPKDKGKSGPSHEGSGLSVSLNPSAWSQIARLNGPTHELNRAGAAFLDYHRFKMEDHGSREWAIAEGLLVWGSFFELSWYDDEADARMRSLFTDETAALAELDEDDPSARLKAVHGWRATPLLDNRIGFSVAPLFALEFAASCWVQDTTSLDGMWWNDEFAPTRLSAPRGVIFADRLSSWTIRRVADG